MSLTHIPEMNMKNFNFKIILTPLICKRDDERGEFEYYDGSTTFYGDATIKEKARKFHKTQSKYIHIKCDCKGKEHKTQVCLVLINAPAICCIQINIPGR